ncbi:MAG: VCBS repeat-containing protein [Myxococcales bacterium]|nr:VCBS repeat-containing protein [Myxococcales bacterium]
MRSFLGALALVCSAAVSGCGGCDTPGRGGPDGSDGAGLCGGVACAADQVCRYDTCVAPPSACVDGRCPGDLHCDTTAGECLPWGVGPGGAFDSACVREVVPGVFFPGAQCEWLGPPAGDAFPDHKNVLGSPMVADLGIGSGEFTSPSIVFISYNFTDGGAESCQGTNPAYFGVLRIIDGATCAQLATLPDPIIAAQSVAIADLGGRDARPEIVAARQDGGLIAFTRMIDGSWGVLWSSADNYGDAFCNWTGLAIHDLDDDGVPEILYQGAVYSNAGVLLNTPIPPTSLEPRSTGYIPVVADVDNDGAPELVSGATIYDWDRATTEWVPAQAIGGVNGRVAVADLGTFGPDPGADDRGALDGAAEIVVVNVGLVHAYTLGGRELFTGALQGAPAGNGGPPTLADFDGDGRVEIASAGGAAYTVFDPDCVAGAPATVCASGRADGILWTQPSQDLSSNVTGSSVFDFEGDGRAEVVYADECFTRVYDGTTGQVVYSRFRRSCTWYENPTVADVDADFNAEIVVNSNANCTQIVCPALDPIFDGVQCLDGSDCPTGTTCGRDQPGDALGKCRCALDADCGGDGFVCRDPIAGPSAIGMVCRAENPGVNTAYGVRVIADRVDRWVSTRPIWNQHAYSVTNVDDNGVVPRTSQWLRNWRQPGLNNFRQNSQGTGLPPGASPDLTVHGAAVTCVPGGARVTANVCNRGTEPVARGLTVSVYGGDPPGALGCQVQTTGTLVPGACVDVSCDWPAAGSVGTIIVDDRGMQVGSNLECREDNNALVVTGIDCPVGP